MIYRKQWTKRIRGTFHRFTGWYLFGFIPLYIRREEFVAQ